MGIEVVVASDVAPQVPVQAVTEVVDKSILHEKENGKMGKESGPNKAIKFGSHEREVEKGISDADAEARMNASADWSDVSPDPHVFYFPKIQRVEDPKYSPQIDELVKEIKKKNEAFARAHDRARTKKDKRSELRSEKRDLRTRLSELQEAMSGKKNEMQPLQQALGKLRNNYNGGICSSEKELDEAKRRLEYRIQHESIPLSEEKQLIRELKQLELTRPIVIANAAMREEIQESLGQKDAIQDQVKHMNVDFGGAKKEHDETWSKMKELTSRIGALDKEIDVIEEEKTAIANKRDELYERRDKIRAQSEELNAPFYALTVILNRAKNLADKEKDVKGVQHLANAEMEKFMLQWRKKAFRDDYKKRLVSSGSLDRRSLTLDGRIRNPDEKPIAVVTRLPPSQDEPLVKPPKPAAKKESLPAKTVQKKTEQLEEVEEEVAGLEKTQEKISPPPVDPAKLKEMKREEEIAKAKLAMERKKKLAEKAAAKAAKRAEKEAEKKLKEIITFCLLLLISYEREKKMKKKAGGPGSMNEDEKAGEESVEGSEPEEAKGAAVPAPVKEQVKRENPVRYRNRPRGTDSVPRALLKKKKSTNYWLWAAPAAVVAVLLAFLAYYYLL
ncbi:unnamed protein product [Linum trigynum]|uniref:Proton pump-interactor 1-like n=1 Tax=Linum trigynum TaxID=586398 RepID=A0AAV2EJZ4_9ROSI